MFPALPPKAIKAGGGGPEFLNARARFLTVFLNDLLAIPYLKDEPAVKEFLTRSTGSDFDSYKKTYRMIDTDGLQEWFHVVDARELLENPESRIKALLTQVGFMEQEVSAAIDAAEAVQKAAAVMSGSVAALKSRLSGVRGACHNGAEALAGPVPGLAAPLRGLNEDLALVDGAMDVWAKETGHGESEVCLFLTDSLSQQLHFLQSIRTASAHRDTLLQAYTKATNHRDGLDLQIQAAQNSGKAKPEKIEKLNTQFAMARVDTDGALQAMERCTKGLLHIELPRAMAEVHQVARSGMGQLAALQMATAVRLRGAWHHQITAMGFDLKTVAELAPQSLKRGVIVKQPSGNPFAPAVPTGASAGAGAAHGDSPVAPGDGLFDDDDPTLAVEL